jgi:hypothetical protein
MVAWLQTVQPRLGERAIEVRADNLHDCMQDLDQGNVDALICYAHDALPIEIDVRRFPWHTIADSVMVPVARPDRQGRATFSLRRRPAQPLPLLSYGAESYLGRAVWHTIDQLHLRRALAVAYESALSDSLRAAALAGFGLAWLPLHLVAEDLDRGVLVHAGVPPAQVVEPPPGAPADSEGLWRALQPLRAWAGAEVRVVRGEQGREWLADTLAREGAQVRFVAAYRRLAPEPDAAGRALLEEAQAAPAAHWWHFSSSEAIYHLAALAPGASWQASQALATHPRIAQAARALGFGRVVEVEAGVQAAVDALHRQNEPLRKA